MEVVPNYDKIRPRPQRYSIAKFENRMICPYLKKTLFTLGHYTKLDEPKSPYLGTFICVDQLMKAVDSKQSCEVDVFHTVYQLRRDRRYMVQTRAQYEFVYRSVI